MAFWVYVLQCSDGKYYTGHSDDLERRIAEHQAGFCGFTSRRRPVHLIWRKNFPTRVEALEAEKQIKPWSRAKKEALFRGDWVALQYFAKSPSERPSTSLGTNGMGLPSSGNLETCASQAANTAKSSPLPFVSSEVEARFPSPPLPNS